MQAECSDDVMKLDIGFNDTFTGMIYSAGKTNPIVAARTLLSKV